MTDPGTLVAGRYRIVRHLGSGAMASVHLAEDEVLGRPVALKSVHAEPESEYGRRVRREARIGAGLHHPSLVTVYDTIVDGRSLLLVMEFVPGQTLGDALGGGPMEPRRALEILRPVAEALDHAHGAGVVHRDVKPANVLLHERGGVKLADLGVATSDEATRITQTGGMVGTAAYMAPEQFDPGTVTAAVDVYALAALAFEMLAGRRPYTGSFFEVMRRAREGSPPDLREALPDAPEAAAQALQRGMAEDPSARPITAGALVDELEAAYRRAGALAADDPRPHAPEPPPAPPPTRQVGEPPAPADPTPTPTPGPTPTRAPTPAPAPVAASRRLEPTPAPRPGATTPRPRRLLPLGALLLALLALGIGAAVLAGGSEDPASDRADEPPSTSTGDGASSTPGTSPPAGTEPRLPAARPTTPAGAIRAFYERAAEDDFDGAWALAGPGAREQFGGSRSTFDGTFGTLESIEFTRLEETARSGGTATVAIATVARHTNRTERCEGTMQARRRGSRWQVARVGVQCART